VSAFEYDVEPDAGSATYFWAAAALVPGAVARAEGIEEGSLQGDAEFPRVLARMGATLVDGEGEGGGLGVRGPASLAPVMADMADMPDAAITLAVVAAFAAGPSVIRGLRTLRVKESDRIAALQTELAKMGVRVETDVRGDKDAITVTPPVRGIEAGPDATPVEFDTYDDHRMAMGLSLVGLRRPNVAVRNPRCVSKTYPGFWRDLARLY
jgi:3-phosphoshikimate 1-carboxyvinyltransferase